MVKLSDANLGHLLEDPGSYFAQPSDVAVSSLSRDGKLQVLNAWRRWLLSDHWHAENTDENHRNRDLKAIEDSIADIEGPSA